MALLYYYYFGGINYEKLGLNSHQIKAKHNATPLSAVGPTPQHTK